MLFSLLFFSSLSFVRSRRINLSLLCVAVSCRLTSRFRHPRRYDHDDTKTFGILFWGRSREWLFRVGIHFSISVALISSLLRDITRTKKMEFYDRSILTIRDTLRHDCIYLIFATANYILRHLISPSKKVMKSRFRMYRSVEVSSPRC